MIKFLIKFASFVACAGILAFGGYQTVQEIKIDEMIGEIETAMENTPILPEFGNPDDNEGGESAGGDHKPGDETPGGDIGSGDSGLDEGDIGGNDNPGGDAGSGDSGSGDSDQGGNDNPGGDAGSGDSGSGDGDQGGNDNPGGDAGSGDDDQGGNDNPGGNDPQNPPQNETLSSESAQEALGNLYDNSDPEFNDLNREFFVGMVEGFLGGNNNETPEPDPDEPPVEEPDFDESFDGDFGGEFNPDEYEPEEEEPEDGGQNEVNDLIVDVAGTYFDNLQAGIQQNQQDNADATEEEQQAARDEFIQQESEAFAGLINIATRPEETTEEQLVQSVDAVINSSVCLDTVTQSVEKNESLTTTVQDATANMNEETKAEIETKLNDAIASNPEKEQQYKDLANLFGITLGEGEATEIPDGINPDDYPS